jgi:hypothetical protein
MSGTSRDSARAAKWLRLKISRCVGCSAAYLEGIRTVFSPMGEQTECFNRSLELVLRSNKKPIPPGFCSYAHNGWRRGVKDGHRFRKSKQKHITTAVAARPNTEVQIVPADGRYPVNGNTPDQGPRPKTLCACWRRCDSRHRRCMPAVFHAACTFTFTFKHTCTERKRELAREMDA